MQAIKILFGSFFLLAIVSSCTIERRHTLAGYHVDWRHSKPKNIGENANENASKKHTIEKMECSKNADVHDSTVAFNKLISALEPIQDIKIVHLRSNFKTTREQLSAKVKTAALQNVQDKFDIEPEISGNGILPIIALVFFCSVVLIPIAIILGGISLTINKNNKYFKNELLAYITFYGGLGALSVILAAGIGIYALGMSIAIGAPLWLIIPFLICLIMSFYSIYQLIDKLYMLKSKSTVH